MKNSRGKILHYFSYDFTANPWLGGGAYRDIEILSRFRSRFDSVHLYVGHYPGARRHTLRGVEVIPLGFGGNEVVSRITYILFANLRLLFMEKEPVGVNQSIYAPLWTSWLHRKRMYAVLHHIIGRQWLKKLGVFGWILHGLESLYQRVPRFFVVSNADVGGDISRRLPKTQVLLSSNAFDPLLLTLADESDSGPPLLFFLGRIDPFMKGLDLLIDAFAGLAAKYPELELIIAGKGDPASEAALLAQARAHGLEKRFSLRQSISEEEKRRLLARCLMMVSPSRFEGFGIAVLEASAAGKPVVVSRASGFKQSVSDGYSGIMVDIEDKLALPAAIMDLLDDPEKRKRMGKQAREWAHHFTWDAIAEKEGEWLKERLGWD
jgi:glycosyltransferase involved in cell wall biosynthesis